MTATNKITEVGLENGNIDELLQNFSSVNIENIKTIIITRIDKPAIAEWKANIVYEKTVEVTHG